MISVLDNDVERRPARNYPVTELLRTYLRQSRGPSLDDVDTAREPTTAVTTTTTTSRAQDLWDYLGDFA